MSREAVVSERQSSAGMSLIEVIVAMVILVVGVVGVAQYGLVARQQARRGQVAMDVWSVGHLKMEEILAQDFASIASGSDTVRGYPVRWTVTSTDPKRIKLVIERNSLNGQGVVADTLVRHVRDWGSE